jgi:hypothetical protein
MDIVLKMAEYCYPKLARVEGTLHANVKYEDVLDKYAIPYEQAVKEKQDTVQ